MEVWTQTSVPAVSLLGAFKSQLGDTSYCVFCCCLTALSRFLTSDHSMAPVRFNWSVFARKMHSTSEFAKMFLSKCVSVSVFQFSATNQQKQNPNFNSK